MATFTFSNVPHTNLLSASRRAANRHNCAWDNLPVQVCHTIFAEEVGEVDDEKGCWSVLVEMADGCPVIAVTDWNNCPMPNKIRLTGGNGTFRSELPWTASSWDAVHYLKRLGVEVSAAGRFGSAKLMTNLEWDKPNLSALGKKCKAELEEAMIGRPGGLWISGETINFGRWWARPNRQINLVSQAEYGSWESADRRPLYAKGGLAILGRVADVDVLLIGK